IRELKNLLERALIFSAGGTIEVCHLDFQRGGAPAVAAATVSAQAALQLQSMPLNLKQAEVLLIQRALQQCQGNMSETARVLGVNRATLYRFINSGNNLDASNAGDANMEKKG